MTLQPFPTKWKKAEVIMLNMPGKNQTFLQNYRPISLLSSASKVVERILLARIKEEIRRKELLPPGQFGFQNKLGRGTTTANYRAGHQRNYLEEDTVKHRTHI